MTATRPDRAIAAEQRSTRRARARRIWRLGLPLALALTLALAASASAATLPRLPRSFVWGVSSSAWQSEGGFVNDNWHHYAAQHPSWDPIGRSVDFLHRYPQDIALASRLGVNTYRIGISWARVEPRRGVFDQRALAFYGRVMATMARHHIQPLVTLSHWDYPMWVFDQGSWASARTVDDFLNYVRVVVRRYRRYVHYWLTFNEATFYRLVEQAYRPLTATQVPIMADNMVAAHRRAYDVIHRLEPRAKVSTNVAWVGPATTSDPIYLDRVADKLDYVGLDYYYPGYSTNDLSAVLGGMAWQAQLDPFGMYESLRAMALRFPRLPVMVVENGMPTDNGRPRDDGYTRAKNLRDDLYWLARARQDGVNVIGYMYWSITDNYEAGSYRPRFGLYTVDVRTDPSLRRRPTDAVPAYRAIIRGRGVPAGYRLARPPAASDCMQSVPPFAQPTCLSAAGP